MTPQIGIWRGLPTIDANIIIQNIGGTSGCGNIVAVHYIEPNGTVHPLINITGYCIGRYGDSHEPTVENALDEYYSGKSVTRIGHNGWFTAKFDTGIALDGTIRIYEQTTYINTWNITNLSNYIWPNYWVSSTTGAGENYYVSLNPSSINEPDESDFDLSGWSYDIMSSPYLEAIDSYTVSGWHDANQPISTYGGTMDNIPPDMSYEAPPFLTSITTSCPKVVGRVQLRKLDAGGTITGYASMSKSFYGSSISFWIHPNVVTNYWGNSYQWANTYIDDNLVDSIQGTDGGIENFRTWNYRCFNISGGPRTFKLTIERKGSLTRGAFYTSIYGIHVT